MLAWCTAGTGTDLFKHTIDGPHQFDEMETGTTDRATVGSFHPWSETFVVQVVPTRPQMGDQLGRVFVGRCRDSWLMFGLGGPRGGGIDAGWRLGSRVGKGSCNLAVAAAQVS